MRVYHVSYDHVPVFTPRIPRCLLHSEDETTPRICFAQTIKQCINAKGGNATAIRNAIEIGDFSLLLFVYSIDLSNYQQEEWIGPCELVKNYGVLDAEINKETWLLVPPRDLREEILVVDSATTFPVEADKVQSWTIKHLVTHPVSSVPENSWQHFLRTNVPAIVDKYGIDTILSDLPVERMKA